MSPSQNNWPFVINVGNSIIGVTVLAMPFCYKLCGMVLGSLLLFFSTWLTIKSCQILMKAGVTARRRSYSMLAYYTLGATGKLTVEIGMIGLQLGTLIAQVVIIGDLGPAIVSKATGLENSPSLRTALIAFLCIFVGLPLGLLKDVRTLSKASMLCIAFYAFFTFYVVLMSIPKLLEGTWYTKVRFWDMNGFFRCLPIFSFAFGCQTQLFIVYDALSEPSLKRINSIVGSAVNMCTVVYMLVGFFGYIAFCDEEALSGDIINHFEKNSLSDAIKMCFVFSIAVSIPLIVFPCRASLYTLLFPQKPKDDFPGSGKIPEFHFMVITGAIITGSMVIGILVPNIEFVLAMNGATMGTLICYIFPALFFLNIMSEVASEKLTAKMVLALGLIIMVASTYTTLNAQPAQLEEIPDHVDAQKLSSDPVPAINDLIKDSLKEKEAGLQPDQDDKRQEPPIPQEPDEIQEKEQIRDKRDENQESKNKILERDKDGNEMFKVEKNNDVGESVHGKNDDKVQDVERQDGVIEKEEEKKDEIKDKDEGVEKDKAPVEEKIEKKQEEILQKLEQQQEEQQKLIEEQKQILEELKQHQVKHQEAEVKQDKQENDMAGGNRSPQKDDSRAGQQVQAGQGQDSHIGNQGQQAGVVFGNGDSLEGAQNVNGGNAGVGGLQPNEVFDSKLGNNGPGRAAADNLQMGSKKAIVDSLNAGVKDEQVNILQQKDIQQPGFNMQGNQNLGLNQQNANQQNFQHVGVNQMVDQILGVNDNNLNVGLNQQNVGANQQIVGANQQNIGANQLNAGAIQQNVGAIQQNVGANQQIVGANQQNIGANQLNAVANQQNVGINQQNAGLNQQNVGINQQNAGAIQQNADLYQQNVAANQQVVGANHLIAGVNQQNAGLNQHNFGANQQNVAENQQNVGAQQLNVGANLQNIGANQGNLQQELQKLDKQVVNQNAQPAGLNKFGNTNAGQKDELVVEKQVLDVEQPADHDNVKGPVVNARHIENQL